MLGAVMLGLFSFWNAGATERIVCHSQGPQPVTITVARAPSPGLPPDFQFLRATVESESRHIRTRFLVKRVRTRAYLQYEDFLGPQEFRLTFRHPDSSHLMAQAMLWEGKASELELATLHCQNEGSALPPAPSCPEGNPDEALFRVARIGSAQDLGLVLECGAEIDARNARGCTALQLVTDQACGYVPSLPEPGNPWEHPSAPQAGPRNSGGLGDILKALIAAGAEVNPADPVSGKTPLMNLVEAGYLSETDVLLEARANLDAQDREGRTALMFAAERGDEVQIRGLLGYGPDLRLKDAKSRTAYDLAIELGFVDLAEDYLKVSQLKVETIAGGAEGTCSPTMVHLMAGKEVTIRLQASADEMFLLQSPDLGIELMAMPGGSDEIAIRPAQTGTFPFTCGVHGGAIQTRGSFMVM